MPEKPKRGSKKMAVKGKAKGAKGAKSPKPYGAPMPYGGKAKTKRKSK